MYKNHSKEYDQVVRQYGWNHWLSTQTNTPTGDNTCSTHNPLPSHFSPEIFMEYLSHFIIADDQVSLKLSLSYHALTCLKSIHIIKCPEFQDLCLILHETLSDDDIPHCDKMRESIISLWHDSFQVLKSELSVSLRVLLSYALNSLLSIGIQWANQLHCRYLVKLKYGGVLGINFTLDVTARCLEQLRRAQCLIAKP